MQINFTGTHGLDTPALRDFTRDKLGRLQRYYENITTINVTFDKEKLQQVAEATILIPGATIHASSAANDMYSAVDALVDKLNRQLIKHKEKERD